MCLRSCKADGAAGSAVPGAALSAGVGIAWAVKTEREYVEEEAQHRDLKLIETEVQKMGTGVTIFFLL